ncbi:N-6 DNA methylase [Terrabacter tumescens]|nr:N-6 DNA methylase [Terrabacter tumescens]
MLAGDTQELRKARGAFFTPDELCRYVVDWAIRDGSEDVLEPSCGEAAFLVAAAKRLDQLQVAEGGRLAGVELHAGSSAHAASLVRAAGRRAEITTADFFTVQPEPSFSAVVGNPPYVRYQDFAGEARALSQRAALAAGVPLTGLASSWAAFTVHSALFLRPGGRLGLVLPAELLTVNYAAPVRRFLLERFARVRLVLFTERVFPEVQEEVVLLLAEGYGQSPSGVCELHQVHNAESLARGMGVAHRWTPKPSSGKWTASMLSAEALKAFTSTTEDGDEFTTLEAWGDTTLGMVTGNNKYFTLTPARAKELRLPPRELLPISPPGSRHLRSLTFSGADWSRLGRDGAPTLLFRPAGKPSAAAAAYIAQGEVADVSSAYKCRVRKPWWRVPLVQPADLFLTYMNADAPRLCDNMRSAFHLNSVHGVYLKDEVRSLGKALLPLASLSSATLVGGETVGRAYGGGMLKLEPREADRLPLPSPALLNQAQPRLESVRPQLTALTQAGQLLDASRVVDDVLLRGELGMRPGEISLLREAHRTLMNRRKARGKS